MMMPAAQPSHGPAHRTIAGKLRQAREDRNWTLEELSTRTRIPVRHLHTIESGRGLDLPGGFIGKSFVRQYAEAVGVDAEQALREFIAETGVDLEVPFQERKISPFTPESLQRFQTRMWRNVGMGIGLLVLLISLAVYFFQRMTTDGSAAIAQPPAGNAPSATSLAADPVLAAGEKNPSIAGPGLAASGSAPKTSPPSLQSARSSGPIADQTQGTSSGASSAPQPRSDGFRFSHTPTAGQPDSAATQQGQ